MKTLFAIFAFVSIFFFAFGKIKINGLVTHDVVARAVVSVIVGFFMALLLGLPLLGILSLF